MLNKWGPEQAIRLAMVIVRFPLETKEGWWRRMNELYGIHRQTCCEWQKREPLFRAAQEMALDLLKRKEDERQHFGEFVLTRMSDENKELYDQLVFWEDNPNSEGAEKARGRVRNMAEQERRQMFVQCMAANGFVYSRACKLMGVSGDTVQNWCRERGFRKMVNQVQQLKKDFFEQALVDVVSARDTQAIIFANKTLNRDRGYGDNMKVQMEGKVDHTHTHTLIPLQALEALPTETLELVLQAVQAHKAKQIAAQAAGPSVLTPPGGEGEVLELNPPQDADEGPWPNGVGNGTGCGPA